MIEKEKIEEIKTTVDLLALVESKGIALKKNGKGWFGLCPFHHDKTPSLSVNPTTNLWQCFGCGQGGDVIRFVEMFEQVDFKEAVSRLSNQDIALSARPHLQQTRHKSLTAQQIKLLTRVIAFYHMAFTEDPRAKDYMKTRGITDNHIFSDYHIGFANGTLLNVLSDAEDISDRLKEIGILNSRGDEHFYGYVTFPLYDLNGNPSGIYGRRVEDMISGSVPDHLYLSGPRSGIFNRQAVKSNKDIILTESIIDALTLISHGIKNVIPCYGTNGFTDDHLNLFKQSAIETIHICFDADESGQRASRVVADKLRPTGINTVAVNLPDGQDINEYFSLIPLAAGQADPATQFKALLQATNPAVSGIKDKKETQSHITKTEYGFMMIVDGRRYEVRGIYKRDNKLKATVKGIHQKRFHVDTVDFYNARSRNYLVKGLCDLFGTEENIITDDMAKLLEASEIYSPDDDPSSDKPKMTAEQRKTALTFLKNPNMFEEILSDFETIGYTGEEMNKLLCYIAAISRKMESPLSVMIQSRSAAGKSYLQDSVLSLIPDEDFIKYTRLTDQALFYKDSDSLAHKILAIEELDGMNGAIYSIRSIQSSKKITIAYTGKDPATGKMRTEENTVEGPLMVFITTTQVDIDGETASRFVFISIDESEAMTQKILEKQRESHTMAGMLGKLKSDEIIKKHQNANRLLRPLYVINPYATLLTFTSKSLRTRRDHTKYLNLISAVAYLYQYQRKIKTMDYDPAVDGAGGNTIEYINVTLEDIEKANKIANEVLGRTLDEISPSSRKLLMIIKEMSEKAIKEKKTGEYHFNRRHIREYSGWSDFQIRTHIRQLEELEYIFSVTGKRGKEYVYELVYTGGGEDGNPFLVGLTDIRELKKKALKLNIVDDSYEG